MDKETLEILYRFTSGPNKQGLCGAENAAETLRHCWEREDFIAAEKILRIFSTLTAYQEVLAQITGLEPFSHPLVKAYIIGSHLLEAIKPSHFNLLLDKFIEYQVIQPTTADLIPKPKIFIPTHNFHTHYIIQPSVYYQCGVLLGKYHKKGKITYAAIHHQRIVKILTKEETKNYLYWTTQVLQLLS